MDKKKKKKNVFLKKIKKIKKIILALWREFVELLKKIYKNFMALPSRVRYIVYVWFGVVAFILILLAGSVSNSNFMKKYSEIENAMNESALYYIQSEGVYPVEDNKLILDLEVLRDENYIYEDEITDKTCSGFSVIFYDDIKEEYEIDSYINCKKYTTKGYLDYKE